MIRATSVVRRPAVKPERVADTLSLDHEARHRRRISLTAEGGLGFLLDLDRATVVDDGDALRLEDGRLVQVRAAPERLIEVTAASPARLMRIAWHIGNRHVAAEIGPDAIHIGHDHVLLEMIRGLGGTAREVVRPFRPERGAYEGGHDHANHDHAGHDHHDHGQHHDHAPGDHAHGDACGCGHAHGHRGHAQAHHGHDHAGGGHAHGGHAHGGHAHEHRHYHGDAHGDHEHAHGRKGHGHRHG